MCQPFITLDTDTVFASQSFGLQDATVFTEGTVWAGVGAMFAGQTFLTDSSAVTTVCFTLGTHGLHAVATVIAVIAHGVGTVGTFATVRTELINTTGAFTAFGADTFGAACTNAAAVFADFCTVTAQHTIFAKAVITGTFYTPVTGGTEFVSTVGAFLAAVRTDIGALLTSLTAGTDYSTFSAQATAHAEALRIGTIAAGSAFLTDFIGAVGAHLTAFLTDKSTIGTTVATGAGHSDTGDT